MGAAFCCREESKIPTLIFPKGEDDVQTFEMLNVAYNMHVPKDTANFRNLMEAIIAFKIDDWTEEKYMAWMEKHIGDRKDYDKNWLCTLNENNDWRYDNPELVQHVKGHIFPYISTIETVMNKAIEDKAKIGELDVEVWANCIASRLGGGSISFTTKLD